MSAGFLMPQLRLMVEPEHQPETLNEVLTNSVLGLAAECFRKNGANGRQRTWHGSFPLRR
jgi:hypothetical protein